ncbi:glycosyltransferase family 4 protein [Flavobacterium sp. GT3R68]|uniref:glycosyltransferase family 4 protein n=1 Tax=Flavobacterium sp. GT3R68 TaxID=2594437 RepID=UPI000F87D3C0|nr:glycosyltransferase [Flavobacterium sp. GT3R68]RTY92248.1 glycosyltransferase family 1 protein [Flavobacterium sp. GSN2]TRW92484.1 glycosyltransferase [Flavobacterium sp. GT3R68]
MKVLVVSSAPLIPSGNRWKAYSPYVKEMEIWNKHAGELQFCSPTWETNRGLLVKTIPFSTPNNIILKDFDIKSFGQLFNAMNAAVQNSVKIFKAMRQANHIHLRCPGNIGLLGAIVQIAFPNTPKTAKYAGNWDPNSAQPWSYRLQKWILSNTFLTKNMQVLVYGEWDGSTENIKPFFTATYNESDKIPIIAKDFLGTIRFLFIGTLSHGKRPQYAIALVEQLQQMGYNVKLDYYGEGNERTVLEKIIAEKQLQTQVTLHGNMPSETIRNAYQHSHFLILPSQSEGWPKVVAEAMFWGCLPIVSPVSCVPNMLDKGERGIVLTMENGKDVQQIKNLLDNEDIYQSQVLKAEEWSRKYTLDYFEEEIEKLVHLKSLKK